MKRQTINMRLLYTDNKMLIINRYTCPIKGKITIMAHEISQGKIVKSYNKMVGLEMDFFSQHKFVIICDVVRSQNLSQVNIINQ